MSDLLQKELQEEALQSVCSLFEELVPNEESSFGLQALEKLKRLGFPTQKDEAFQYVPVKRSCEVLAEKSLSDLEDGAISFQKPKDSYCLVFKNGIFEKDLSFLPDSLIALSLQEALKSSYGAFLKHRLQMQITSEPDSFALLTHALGCGFFLYIPPATSFDLPLEIIHMQTKSAPSFVGSKVLLFVGARSKIEVITRFMGDFLCRGISSHLLDVSLEESSCFSHVCYSEEVNPSQKFLFMRATLKKESHLNSFLSAFGSSLFRADYRVSLLGEGANAELNGLSLLKSTQSHVHVHMEHSAPSCRSHQFFKNVLTDSQSRSSFTGKIYVKRPAQKTVAYQLNQNLLLSEGAIANTKPNLEIFADDVKASHGATVSQLDAEQIFYLQTRGIKEKEAKSLLTIGFCASLLDKVPIQSTCLKLRSQILDFLSKQGL